MESNRKAIEGRSSDPCSPSLETPETDIVWAETLRWCHARDEYHDPQHAALANLCTKLERERDEALTALMEIEEIYVDGFDTYEDWKSMGTIAREFLSKQVHPWAQLKRNHDTSTVG